MKYSTNLEKVLEKIKEFQPALVDMLEEHVLSEGDGFFHKPWGEEYPIGQVCTKKSSCLYLYETYLELTADANVAAAVANSVTEYTYCNWCSVKVTPMSDGLRNHFTLHVSAQWVLSK